MSSNVDLNVRPGYDSVISEIADYVSNYQIDSELALDTARNCLIDTIGCGLLALKFPACTKMLGPVVEGTSVPYGVRVPGTNFKLDPIKGPVSLAKVVLDQGHWPTNSNERSSISTMTTGSSS